MHSVAGRTGHLCQGHCLLRPSPRQTTLRLHQTTFQSQSRALQSRRKQTSPLRAGPDVSEARHTLQTHIASSVSAVQKAALAASLGFLLLTGMAGLADEQYMDADHDCSADFQNMSCLQDMLRLETLQRLGFASPRTVRCDSFMISRTNKVLDDSLPSCKAMQQ